VSESEAAITPAEQTRDLAGRALGAAAFVLFFAPWLDGGRAVSGVGSIVYWREATGWVLLRHGANAVARAGLALPIEAGSASARARTVEVELVCVLWASYLACAALLVFVPRRRTQGRLALTAALVTAFATLCLMEGTSCAVTDPEWVGPVSLAAVATYLPATAFVALLFALAWRPTWARAIGIILAGSAIFAGPLALERARLSPSWGGVASFLAASAGLFVASLGAGPRRAAEAGA
jgi:hypothetical protein